MTDYRRMYCILCKAASTALDLLPEGKDTRGARAVLQAALLEAEEVYLEAEE